MHRVSSKVVRILNKEEIMDTLYFVEDNFATYYTFDDSDDPEVSMQVLDNSYVVDVQHCPCCEEQSMFDECGYFDDFDQALDMLIRATQYNEQVKQARKSYHEYLNKLSN